MEITLKAQCMKIEHHNNYFRNVDNVEIYAVIQCYILFYINY